MARAVVGDLGRSRDLEHLRQVNAACRFARRQERPPLPLTCTLWDMHYKTAVSWTSKDRRAGLLTARWKPRAKDHWGTRSRAEPDIGQVRCSSWAGGLCCRPVG